MGQKVRATNASAGDFNEGNETLRHAQNFTLASFRCTLVVAPTLAEVEKCYLRHRTID